MGVEGHVAAGFESVRDAFEANFDEHGDVGAAFCLHVDGEVVVDLWGGTADVATERPWREDTLQLVFSTTKAATATCALMLVERGEIDLDAPVVEYWPEFGGGGKENISVRYLLSHRSGLAALERKISVQELLAWREPVAILEAQKPLWEPGTAHGYHAWTFGHLVGELIRRVSGRSVGRFFAEEVADPLGLEFWIGLPGEHDARAASLIPFELSMDPGVFATLPEILQELVRAQVDPDSMLSRSLNITSDPIDWNSAEVRAAEIPSGNGVGTARALSRMYAALIGEVDGIRLLHPSTIDAARTTQTMGRDLTLVVPTNWGLGFQLPIVGAPLSGTGAFGHGGMGGSLAFADPEAGIAFAYVMNRMMIHYGPDPRTAGLIEATLSCL